MNKFLKTVEVLCLAVLAADAILDIAALVREARESGCACKCGHCGHDAEENDFELGY